MGDPFSDGGILLMTVTGVHGRVPVGDKMVGQRGVKFGLRRLHPVAHLLDAHPFGQPRQGVLAAHTVHVHDGGDGRIVGQPADVAEAFAFDQRGQDEAVEDFAHGRGVGTGAGDGAALGAAFDEAEVFEEAAPGHQTAVSGEGGVGAGEGEFARQGVEREGVREDIFRFTRQVKRNQ